MLGMYKKSESVKIDGYMKEHVDEHWICFINQ